MYRIVLYHILFAVCEDKQQKSPIYARFLIFIFTSGMVNTFPILNDCKIYDVISKHWMHEANRCSSAHSTRAFVTIGHMTHAFGRLISWTIC